ncbi:MAG TPA: ComEC/Rec2 family competence protein [Salinivirgaceae bacterium]|nr:ComEC/Rec2 family competence protein [Salinivirgaceae bacterium]
MIDFVRKAPFFRIFALTVTGIILSRFIEPSTELVFVIALFLGLLSLILFFITEDIFGDLLGGFVLNLALIATGFYLGLNSLPLRDIPKVSENQPFYALVENVEYSGNGKSRFLVKLVDQEQDRRFSKKMKARLNVVGNVDIRPGDVVYCKRGLKPIQNIGEIGEFDYKGFSARRGIYYTAQVDSSVAQTVFHIEPSIFKRFESKIKNSILSLMDRYGFAADEKSVLLALTTGDKSLLDNNIRSSFSAAGLMHILAVSGLHVGIIYLILLYLLKPIQNFRGGVYVRNIIAIILLFSYAVFTGMTPSVLRATLMFSFLIIGQMFNRKYSSINSLFASAFILTLFNPNFIYDVGFQLSYVAVLGIILFYKPINAWVTSENSFLTKVWSMCALSLAAQIATTPISLFYFHQFPTYFLLGNLLIVPLVGFIIQGALLFFAFGFWETIANILAFGVRFLIKVMLNYAAWVETLPASVISNIFFDIVVLILLYLILLYLYSFFTYPFYKRLLISSALILTVAGYQLFRSFSASQIEDVYSTKDKNPTLIFVSKKSFSTVSTDSVENFELLKRKVSSHYSRSYNHVGHTQITSNGAIIRFNGKEYLFFPTLNAEGFKRKGITIPTDVSKIFLRNGETIELPTKSEN